ncbi:MAG: hypothetical protein IPO81_21460 [Kouleothrix sp.]|nr:hypothetical protein [Kouleothrix sp.]
MRVATIYVSAQGRIVGGPTTGKIYQGSLNGHQATMIRHRGQRHGFEADNGNDVIQKHPHRHTARQQPGATTSTAARGQRQVDGGNDNLPRRTAGIVILLTQCDSDDALYGGNGDDRLEGGNGNDLLTGGANMPISSAAGPHQTPPTTRQPRGDTKGFGRANVTIAGPTNAGSEWQNRLRALGARSLVLSRCPCIHLLIFRLFGSALHPFAPGKAAGVSFRHVERPSATSALPPADRGRGAGRPRQKGWNRGFFYADHVRSAVEVGAPDARRRHRGRTRC